MEFIKHGVAQSCWEMPNDAFHNATNRVAFRLYSFNQITLIETVQSEGDSIGGIVKCVIRHLPTGLGDPVFDKLHADLGKAMLSINAVKGFDIGAGFDSVGMRGSE